MAPASLLVYSQALESKALKVDSEIPHKRVGAQAFNIAFLERIKSGTFPSYDPINGGAGELHRGSPTLGQRQKGR